VSIDVYKAIRRVMLNSTYFANVSCVIYVH
jgi:hypothetical protein